MIKKSQPFENSQLQDDQTKGEKPLEGKVNHTPKLAKMPVNKFETYQWLLDEFYKANPNPTDAELSSACQYFARQCGLTLASKDRRPQ